MAAVDPTYDLVLLLDLSATDDVRAKIVADTQATIEGAGTLIGHHPWGQRALAYPIEHHESAEYHLFQFHATTELLGSLEHTLRITDGVLRHRVVKLAPGTPPPPETRPVDAGASPPAPAVEVAPTPVPAVEPVVAEDEAAPVEPPVEPSPVS